MKHEAIASNYQFKHKMYLRSLMTVHVRWPARPAEHRAGLDFFGSFCIKAKRTWKKFTSASINFELHDLFFVSFFWASKRKKENASTLYRNILKLLYFLCLETKKDPAQTENIMQINSSAKIDSGIFPWDHNEQPGSWNHSFADIKK